MLTTDQLKELDLKWRVWVTKYCRSAKARQHSYMQHVLREMCQHPPEQAKQIADFYLTKTLKHLRCLDGEDKVRETLRELTSGKPARVTP